MTGDDLFLLASAVWGGALVVFTLLSLGIALLRARKSVRRAARLTNDAEFAKHFARAT